MWPLLLLFMLWSLHAQAATSEQILRTAWTDDIYLSHSDLQASNSANPFRTVEAYVAREGLVEKQETEIGLKFNFKSWPEWRFGQDKTLQQQLLREASLGWALRERYAALLSYSFNEEKIELLKETLSLSEAQVKAQALSLKAGKVTPKSFLSAKIEMTKLRRTQNALHQERTRLQRQFREWLPEWSASNFDTGDRVTVQDIASYIGEQPNSGPSLTNKLATKELQDLEEEMQVVRGRERQWFKAFEVAQARNKGEENYEVQLTFQLPIFSSDDIAKQKQNEIILKTALKQKELRELNYRLESLKLQILSSIEMYKLASEGAEISIKSSGTDPLANIERKISANQERLELLSQQQEITALYLDYLLESEVLVKAPEKNYLEHRKRSIP